MTEEPALYRAILDAPHDDTARLVYADWLDEFAETLPEPQARLERGRAELIRVQCQIARRGPGGWGRNSEVPIPPALLNRQKRLRFLFSEKLRRGLPGQLAGHPFDRGFFRPLVWTRPDLFPGATEPPPPPQWTPVPALPADHPMRRYVTSTDLFDAFPLWDVHLYGWADGGHPFDPRADFGQYGELLARCARNPAMARVGWLQVSFFRTSAVEFLLTGAFPNVETLVLNCGPFPAVLGAVAGNESFRSLRYIEFGTDTWAWCVTPAAQERIAELGPKIADLNQQHLPYGEMRGALQKLLGGLEPIPPVRLPLRMPEWARLPTPAPAPAVPAPAPAPRPVVRAKKKWLTAYNAAVAALYLLLVVLCVVVLVCRWRAER